MKRAVLSLLIATLALPLFALETPANTPCAGLTSAQVVSLEHVKGEWQMKIHCAQGLGTIVMAGGAHYRGDGLFSGWTETQMREVYVALSDRGRSIELLQLG